MYFDLSRSIFLESRESGRVLTATDLNDLESELEKDFSEFSFVPSYWDIKFSYYFIDEELDEDQQDEIMEYFMQSETDEIRAAEEYFDGDFEEEPLRLMRIKFMSEIGN